MFTNFARDPKPLLAFAALLEGCGYYVCKDDLKRDYVPTPSKGRWQDAQTLEVQFGDVLRPPTDVDPRRFALLRYNVDFLSGGYYCFFEVCYREVEGVEAIPESISWDPAEPQVLRLHFAEPIPASACDPWRGNRGDFQALELLYLAETDPDLAGFSAEPGLLAYEDDQGVEALGDHEALQKVEDCYAGGSCEFDDFCVPRGSYEYSPASELRVDCPNRP